MRVGSGDGGRPKAAKITKNLQQALTTNNHTFVLEDGELHGPSYGYGTPVLSDLVARREVCVEVVLAVKVRYEVDPGTEGKASQNGGFDAPESDTNRK